MRCSHIAVMMVAFMHDIKLPFGIYICQKFWRFCPFVMSEHQHLCFFKNWHSFSLISIYILETDPGTLTTIRWTEYNTFNQWMLVADFWNSFLLTGDVSCTCNLFLAFSLSFELIRTTSVCMKSFNLISSKMLMSPFAQCSQSKCNENSHQDVVFHRWRRIGSM